MRGIPLRNAQNGWRWRGRCVVQSSSHITVLSRIPRCLRLLRQLVFGCSLVLLLVMTAARGAPSLRGWPGVFSFLSSSSAGKSPACLAFSLRAYPLLLFFTTFASIRLVKITAWSGETFPSSPSPSPILTNGRVSLHRWETKQHSVRGWNWDVIDSSRMWESIELILSAHDMASCHSLWHQCLLLGGHVCLTSLLSEFSWP